MAFTHAHKYNMPTDTNLIINNRKLGAGLNFEF